MKDFLRKISYTIIPVWLFMVALVMYLSLYVCPRSSGDLGRLTMIPFGLQYDSLVNRDALQQFYFHQIDKVEQLSGLKCTVLTIGDSFSKQGATGFQNYLAAKGLSVVHCDDYRFPNPIQHAYCILNEGLIDANKAKVLIIECSERQFEKNFINLFDSCMTIPKQSEKSKNQSERISNAWSLMRARDYLLYRAHIINPVGETDLDGNYFSADDASKLYFYMDDINNGTSIENRGNVKRILNLIDKRAKDKGIMVLWLIAVDKYDLYQKHILNNPYPPKTINEDLQVIMGNSQQFLISKQYLQKMVDDQEKDVFLYNDSHWSWKASSVVANELFRRIKGITN